MCYLSSSKEGQIRDPWFVIYDSRLLRNDSITPPQEPCSSLGLKLFSKMLRNQEHKMTDHFSSSFYSFPKSIISVHHTTKAQIDS